MRNELTQLLYFIPRRPPILMQVDSAGPELLRALVGGQSRRVPLGCGLFLAIRASYESEVPPIAEVNREVFGVKILGNFVLARFGDEGEQKSITAEDIARWQSLVKS